MRHESLAGRGAALDKEIAPGEFDEADVVAARRNEYMQHLGRTDAVHDTQARFGFPRLQRGQGQRFPGGHAQSQPRQAVVADAVQHRAVSRR